LKTTLFRDGAFYKGNVHTHTTRSDGRKTPDAVVAEYKAQGYHFLAITDHNVFTDMPEYNNEEFILLPGMEINAPPEKGNDTEYHILVLPGNQAMRKAADLRPYKNDFRLELLPRHNHEYYQPLVDDAVRRGYWLVMNHPFWSRVEYDQILAFRNLSAIEVYNHDSTIIENTGSAFQCWDAVLRHGCRLWGIASDDTHHFFPDASGGDDAFGGFIQVKARSLSLDGITEAIVAGSFYGSSGGPEIYDFFIEDGKAHLYCSPAARIYFGGRARHMRWGLSDPGGPLLTQLISPLAGDEGYVRAECFDKEGRKSFTNPIWLDSRDM
jgi:hypothetical protein